MTPNQEAAAVIYDAIDYLNKHGWTKGVSVASDGRACMLGALGRTDVMSRQLTARLDAFGALHDALGGTTSVMGFNDDPRTTYEDVILVMKAAAANLESA